MGELSRITSFDQLDPKRDPALLGYPPTLPIEIALKTAPLARIREEYGYSEEEWAELKYNPNFREDLSKAIQTVKVEGMSFRLKARLQAEEMLKTSWRTVHDPATPAAVKADLIKATMRWAGYDNKDNAVGGGGVGFAIQINLNNKG